MATIDLSRLPEYGVWGLGFALAAWMIASGGKPGSPSLLSQARSLAVRLLDTGDNATPESEVRTVDSDKPAPDGFAEHVEVILAACQGADPKQQIEYLRAAPSESEVFRKENKRLVELVTLSENDNDS